VVLKTPQFVYGNYLLIFIPMEYQRITTKTTTFLATNWTKNIWIAAAAVSSRNIAFQ